MSAQTSVVVIKGSPKRGSSPPAHHVNTPPTSFINPWPSFHNNSPLNLLTTTLRRPEFKPVPSREKLVTVQKPDWGFGKDGLKATWIGHATFLIETPRTESGARGVRVLFDPVFSERTSPVSFAGPKRYSPTPCTLEELPDVDLVVISHDHYDHMDSHTLFQLYTKSNGAIHFLVPLRNASRIRGFGIGGDAVTEFDWWESAHVDVAGVGSITMTCTPSQHLSGRGIFDHGSTLWCSWVLETRLRESVSDTESATDCKKLFFAGDTGYRYVPKGAEETDMHSCPAFREIGDMYGPFDLSLLPIGLYSPRHLLSPVHCTPEDALCLHKELKSKKSIGMHYGTVRGGISQYFEEVTEPPRRFREACEKEGKVWGEEVGLIGIGETIVP